MFVFRCSHSGLLLPPDYQKAWGTKYGVGLGLNPVSECVDVEYYAPLPSQDAIGSIDDLMYPVTPTFAQVDLVEVEELTWDAIPAARKLILRLDDRKGRSRAAVILANQLAHPLGAKLRAVRAAMTAQQNEVK